jgi:hypothetical protein
MNDMIVRKIKMAFDREFSSVNTNTIFSKFLPLFLMIYYFVNINSINKKYLIYSIFSSSNMIFYFPNWKLFLKHCFCLVVIANLIFLFQQSFIPKITNYENFLDFFTNFFNKFHTNYWTIVYKTGSRSKHEGDFL